MEAKRSDPGRERWRGRSRALSGNFDPRSGPDFHDQFRGITNPLPDDQTLLFIVPVDFPGLFTIGLIHRLLGPEIVRSCLPHQGQTGADFNPETLRIVRSAGTKISVAPSFPSGFRPRVRMREWKS